MQTLIQILKSGYGYDRVKEDGTKEHVLVAPNKYMITAARTMEYMERSLDAQGRALEQERKFSADLYDNCVKYRKTIEELENAIRTLSDRTSDSTHSPT